MSRSPSHLATHSVTSSRSASASTESCAFSAESPAYSARGSGSHGGDDRGDRPMRVDSPRGELPGVWEIGPGLAQQRSSFGLTAVPRHVGEFVVASVHLYCLLFSIFLSFVCTRNAYLFNYCSDSILQALGGSLHSLSTSTPMATLTPILLHGLAHMCRVESSMACTFSHRARLSFHHATGVEVGAPHRAYHLF